VSICDQTLSYKSKQLKKSHFFKFYFQQSPSLTEGRQLISDALEESYAVIDFGPESEDSSSGPQTPPEEPLLQEEQQLKQEQQIKQQEQLDKQEQLKHPLEHQRQLIQATDENDEDSLESDETSSEKDIKEELDVKEKSVQSRLNDVVVEQPTSLEEHFDQDSLGNIPGPPSGFNDASSITSSDVENDQNDEEDEDDMLAQRGPRAPVLAGPMKFSIGSYKDRTGRERQEPLKIIDSLPEDVIPSMPVPQSPPPPPPPGPPSIENVVKLRKVLPKVVEVKEARVRSPVPSPVSVKFEAVLLPEKPVYIIPKSPTPSTPTPPPLPSKTELRKSADMSDFRFPTPPPPLPTKSETLKRIISSQREGSVSPSPKPNVPSKPSKDHLSNQVTKQLFP